MSTFEGYAEFYDLLYAEKDYVSEISYVRTIFTKYSKHPIKSILSIGCGTGRHESLLAESGVSLVGVDSSERMVEKARGRHVANAEFILSDAADLHLGREFDAVISLFHVMSYQTSNDQLSKVISSVSSHLKRGGLFVFDFWFGPAVLMEKPGVRVKEYKNPEMDFIRVARPRLLFEENIVEVTYEMFIHRRGETEITWLNETHKMRYFFEPELEHFLRSHDLKPLRFEEWETSACPSPKTWGVCCIAVKE